jgi:ornithine decarboxylase
MGFKDMTQAAILRFDRSRIRQLGNEPIYANAAEVAQTLAPDNPVFCFSPAALVRSVRSFQKGFPGEVSYAVKANSSKHVLETLAKSGIEVWDVASVQEMAAVRAVQAQAQFHYHNPVKSRAEIREAFEIFQCRRFAADSAEEIDKIAAVTGDTTAIEIAVRFVLPRRDKTSAHDFSTKFGASESEAASLLRYAAKLGVTPVLTFHPGSQSKDPQAYARYIEAAGRIVKATGIQIAALNLGGGFPARYVHSAGPELRAYFAAIENSVKAVFGERRPKLECEPGRGLAASCMSLLTKVKLVRDDRQDLFINDGVYGALMEVWQVAELQPPYRIIRNGEYIMPGSRPMTVFGPTCDPLDRLPVPLDMPADVQEGDYLEFGTIGAYGSATMTRFNGYGGHETVTVSSVLTI